jgi:hypothetical protein
MLKLLKALLTSTRLKPALKTEDLLRTSRLSFKGCHRDALFDYYAVSHLRYAGNIDWCALKKLAKKGMTVFVFSRHFCGGFWSQILDSLSDPVFADPSLHWVFDVNMGYPLRVGVSGWGLFWVAFLV